MAAVTTTFEDTIAFITVNNPPVNAIGQAVRQGLVGGIHLAEQTPGVKAVIILCEGRTFMAGADIKEFGKPPLEPHLPDVVQVIEDCSIPVVAAIHGQALGGGLEIALGAHYRIATADAKAGLPEVTLGLIPGAGGTQRLPRLVGVEFALAMITGGSPVSAQKAYAAGLFDALSEKDIKEDAIHFAYSIMDKDLSDRRLSGLSVAPVETSFFDEKRAELAKRRRGFEAPQACVDAVEAAVALPFAEGMKKERSLFIACRSSSQSGALRHMFFAERTSLKVEGLDPSIEAMDVKKVAVIGAGTMGSGIAICLADSGLDVVLLEINPAALEAGLGRIEKSYDANIKKGRMNTEEKNNRLAHITGTVNYSALSDVDMVIEAAFERMDIKQDIIANLNSVCKKECIVATNTSYLNVNEIAAGAVNPERVIGLHFFSPANIMKLLEIVRAEKTSDKTLQTAIALAKKIGKIGVVSGVCRGFIGNRMYQCYQREAGLLLLEGATPSQIDKALVDFGMPMGPCAVGDLTGLDISYLMRKSLDESQYEVKAFHVHNKLVEMGRKGQKTGSGFYTYPDGARAGIPDPFVENLIADTAVELGIRRRTIKDEEIIERCIYTLANEGGNILEEGIAQRPSDIDVVFCNGYGFPRWRGGPMYYAQTIGFDSVIKRIEEFSNIYGPRWWTVSEWLKSQ